MSSPSRALPNGKVYCHHTIEEVNGEAIPDHGEIWTLPWEWALESWTEAEATVHLWVETPISASRVEKWLTLRAGEASLSFHHKISNLGHSDQPFLWKLHPAMAIDEHCRIELGAGTMYMEDFGPPRGAQTGVTYQWPYLVDAEGRQHDMRAVLPRSARVNEFQYATELSEGWCALTHGRDRVGFALTFDRSVLSSCWLFATYSYSLIWTSPEVNDRRAHRDADSGTAARASDGAGANGTRRGVLRPSGAAAAGSPSRGGVLPAPTGRSTPGRPFPQWR